MRFMLLRQNSGVEDRLAGKRIKCPACKASLLVPEGRLAGLEPAPAAVTTRRAAPDPDDEDDGMIRTSTTTRTMLRGPNPSGENGGRSRIRF